MKIMLFGKFVESHRTQLERVARERGHILVPSSKKADIAFMMAYPDQLSLVQRALKHSAFVVALESGIEKLDEMRSFFRKGVYDFITLPYGENNVRKMFADLEKEIREKISKE